MIGVFLTLEQIRDGKVALVSKIDAGPARLRIVCKDGARALGGDRVRIGDCSCSYREGRWTGVSVHRRGTSCAVGVGLCLGRSGRDGGGGLAGVRRVTPGGLRQSVAGLVVS